MKPLFLKEPSPTVRATAFIIMSIVLMTADHHHLGPLETIRTYLAVFVQPIQYMVNMPMRTARWLSITLGSRLDLLEENARLHEQNLRLLMIAQKFEDLERENNRLRQLLDSPVKLGENRVMIAEVTRILKSEDSYTRKLEINRGSRDGVFKGQPVFDAQGVMGQVTTVSFISSTVMLITDINHQLHVQMVRTGQRAVAEGGLGAENRLKLLYLPNDASIRVGDLLVTSGLDGIFPPGYPVGQIAEFSPDIAQSYAQVRVTPLAFLERNREVLLVWPEKAVSVTEPHLKTPE
jgi:rod shape-determining protein MreC